jgi:two-component system phosphate regulon response regulator PhoB
VLAARVRAGLRRKESQASSGVWRHGKLSLEVERHTAFLDNSPIELSATEFALLAQFMSHPDIVFSRQRLTAAIRGADYPVTDRSIDVQIMGLRKKLGEEGAVIETIRGVGYRFKTEDSAKPSPAQ